MPEFIPGGYKYESYDAYCVAIRKEIRERQAATRARQAFGKAYRDYHAALPIRAREQGFVDAFFPRVVWMMKHITKKQLNRNTAIAAGLEALNESGYRTKVLNKDGSYNESAIAKVDELMQLPRIQNAMSLKFESIGFSELEASELLVDLLRESKGKAKDLIPSLKLYFELTGQLGPSTKNVSVTNNNLNVQPPKVYDAQVWSKEPRMIISKEKQDVQE